MAGALPRTWPAQGADRGQRSQGGRLCTPLAAGAAARVVAQRGACAEQRLPCLKQLCRVLEQSAGQADLEVRAVHGPCKWKVAVRLKLHLLLWKGLTHNNSLVGVQGQHGSCCCAQVSLL